MFGNHCFKYLVRSSLSIFFKIFLPILTDLFFYINFNDLTFLHGEKIFKNQTEKKTHDKIYKEPLQIKKKKATQKLGKE